MQTHAAPLASLHSRAHERLQEYWDTLRGDRLYPQESEIDPDDIADIWPACFLISLDEVTRRLDYRYTYLGADLIEAYGDDIDNPDIILRLLSVANMPLVQKFSEVVSTKAPVMDESEFVNLKRLNVRYRTCMVPLGVSETETTHILGCMRWRIYP